MADNINKVIIQGEDRTGAMFNSFRRHLDEATASSNMLKTSMKALGVTTATAIAADYIKDITLLAARHETLGVAMYAVGKNAGYNAGQMDAYATGVQKMGITMIESRESVLRMAQANIDLSKSQQLARLAQDAAIIGNVNSSEALGILIHGIQSAQTDVLRTIGINVNFEDSYKKLALQLHKTSEALTESEKMTARTNAVMESGAGIAGTYEAAMGTAGKQMTSLARYSEDAKVKLGSVFSETLLIGVAAYTGHLKDVNSGMDELASNKKLDKWADDVTTNLVFVADSIKYSFGSVVTVLDTAYTALDQILHLLAANPAAARASGDAYSNRLEDRFGADSSLQVIRKELAAKRELDARTVWQPGSVGSKPAYQWSDPSGKAAFEEQEAFIKGAQSAIAKARSEAETEWAKYMNSARSKQEQMAQEIKKAQSAAATLGGDTAKQLPKVIAAIREKYDSGYADAHLALLKSQEDQAAKIEDAAGKASLARLESLHKAQLVSDETYYAQKREAQVASMNASEKALLKEMQAQSQDVARQRDPGKKEESLKKLIELGTKYQEVVIKKAEAEQDDYEWIVKQNSAIAEMQKELDGANKTQADYTAGLDLANQERDFELQALGMAEPLRAAFLQQKREELALEKMLGELRRNGIGVNEEALRTKLRESQANEAALAAAKRTDAEWKRITADIERGLTDSLYRSFEAGKGFGETFVDALKNLFKTTVLKIGVKAIVDPIMGGSIGAANAAGGGGGGGVGVGNLASIFGAGGSISEGVAAAGYFGSTALGASAATSASIGSALAAIPGWGWAAAAGLAVLGGSGLFGGEGITKPSELSLQKSEFDRAGNKANGGYYYVSQNNVPGGDANLPLYLEWEKKVNESIKAGTMNAAELDKLLNRWIIGGQDESAAAMLQKLDASTQGSAAAAAAAAKAEDDLKTARAAAAEQLAKKADDLVDITRRNLVDAYQREIDAKQALMDKMSGYVASLRQFRQSLLIGDLSPLSPGAKYDEARRQFDDVSRRAALGDTAAIEQLQGVSQAYLEVSRAYNASSEAYSRDFSLVSSALANTESVAERQARIAAEAVSVARRQLDYLGDINRSVLTIPDAIRALATALASQSALTEKPVDGKWTSTGGASITIATASTPSTITGKTGATATTQQAIDWVNDRVRANDPMAIYNKAVEEGVSANTLGAMMGWNPVDLNAWAIGQGLPTFAVGINAGLLPKDTILQAHGGEEITPVHYVDKQAADRQQTNAELKEQTAELRRQTAELRDTRNVSVDLLTRLEARLARLEKALGAIETETRLTGTR